ncbi:MAG: hypothetical protein IJO74_04565 [Clostridia bacterium]|nr:hypothetical protein [Clostridia bacterium]
MKQKQYLAEQISEKYGKYCTEYSMIKADLKKSAMQGNMWSAREIILEKRLIDCENMMRKTESEIHSVLEHISDYKLYNLLESRIFMRLTWEEIAVLLEREPRTVYRLKKKAFEEFEKIATEKNLTAFLFPG